jgi:hypothetical protein
MRHLVTAALALFLLPPVASARGHSGGHSSYSHSSSRVSGGHSSSTYRSHSSTSSHRRSYATSASRDSHGRIKRSQSAKNDFKRTHPCPSTGKSSGACPGYVIDHVKPLKRGGADAPSNMQWQTTADAKAKDKWE